MAAKNNNLEMTDKQWVEAALHRACTCLPEMYPGTMYWFSEVNIKSAHAVIGSDFVKGEGEAKVHFRRIKDEELLMPKKCTWAIKVLKDKDSYGIPVAKADELKIKEMK